MKNFQKLERQLKALGNARRLQILSHLKEHKRATVSDIAYATHLSIDGASHHLRILKAVDVVEYRKRGLFVFYRLSLQQGEPMKKVISLL